MNYIAERNKVIAANYITGIEPEWQEYLLSVLDDANGRKLPVDFDDVDLVHDIEYQLHNSTVTIRYKDGKEIIASSQVWIAFKEDGTRELIEPPETSGVLIEAETGKVLKSYNGLPMPLPKGTKHLIRIHIRNQVQPSGDVKSSMRWRLFKAGKSC